MKWIKNSGKNVENDSRNWGNYNDSISPANVSGYSNLQISGYSNYWKVKNIYDLAGNTDKWTNEKYSTFFVLRGGYYGTEGTTDPASYRSYDFGTNFNEGHSFRPSLYIK
ncbi:hypothetical protein D3C73_1416700 [compost metagenome]